MRKDAGLIDQTREPLRVPRTGYLPEHRTGTTERGEAFDLGRPLTIREAASLIGCSVSVVRYRLVPGGLPHFRASPVGKYLFYEHQVRRWILERQKEEGRGRRGSL